MSSVWSNKEYLAKMATSSASKRDMIEQAGMSVSGAAYKTLNKWAIIHAVELPSYDYGNSGGRRQRVDLSAWLEDPDNVRPPKRLVYHLVLAGLKSLECEECGQGTVWNGKPLVLHLDHIDGDSSRTRLDNLRVLCPHCHTQTPTYGYKDREDLREYRMEDNFCLCGQLKYPKEQQCSGCRYDIRSLESSQTKRTDRGTKKINHPGNINNLVLGWVPKIDWPSVEYLEKQLQIRSYRDLEQELGVSATAIKKYLQRNGVEPPRKHQKRDPDGNRTRDSLS